ncbi:unnamed protein product [Leuciscus chuanchicus]
MRRTSRSEDAEGSDEEHSKHKASLILHSKQDSDFDVTADAIINAFGFPKTVRELRLVSAGGISAGVCD